MEVDRVTGSIYSADPGVDSYVNVNVKALKPSIGQSFQKLRVFHRPKASRGKLYSSGICSGMLDPKTWVGGVWLVAGGGWRAADILTSVDIIV